MMKKLTLAAILVATQALAPSAFAQDKSRAEVKAETTSAVKAGENQGETLKHDFVVRQYAPVAAWNAVAGEAMAIRFDADLSNAAGTPTEVNLVVIDAATRRPVQAVKLGC